MICDIVIPTYQRAHVLPQTLEALRRQVISLTWHCRVILSDDGSTDGTLSLLEHVAFPPAWEKIILRGPHTGAGGARNRALKYVQGDVVLFLDADILLRPGALAAHLAFHEHNPGPTAAALGMVRSDPRLHPSPFMEWMEHGGQQNDFDSVLGQIQADPRVYWYGAHLSVKGSLIPRLHFPENFTGYGWEDLSVGHQAAEQGVKLFVLSGALGLHHHFHTVADFARRRYAAGLNILRFQQLHPEYVLLPERSLVNHIRRALFIGLGGQAALRWCILFLGPSLALPRLFLVFTATEFWRGLWRSAGGFLAYIRGNRALSHT